MGTQIYNGTNYLKKKKKKRKVIQKYGRCAETELLSIIPGKNHADQMIPDVLFADENHVIPRIDWTPENFL